MRQRVILPRREGGPVIVINEKEPLDDLSLSGRTGRNIVGTRGVWSRLDRQAHMYVYRSCTSRTFNDKSQSYKGLAWRIPCQPCHNQGFPEELQTPSMSAGILKPGIQRDSFRPFSGGCHSSLKGVVWYGRGRVSNHWGYHLGKADVGATFPSPPPPCNPAGTKCREQVPSEVTVAMYCSNTPNILPPNSNSTTTLSFSISSKQNLYTSGSMAGLSVQNKKKW